MKKTNFTVQKTPLPDKRKGRHLKMAIGWSWVLLLLLSLSPPLIYASSSTSPDDRGDSIDKIDHVTAFTSIIAPMSDSDDGGPTDNYDDTALPDTLEICPMNPEAQVVLVNFTAFDLAPGDIMVVYDSDTSGLATATAISASGTGIPNSPNGGWYQAACTNLTGCLTIIFTPNNDGIKGAGWVLDAVNVDRVLEFECPEGVVLSGDCASMNAQITPAPIDLLCDSMPAPEGYFIAARLINPDGPWMKVNGVNTFLINGADTLEYGVWKSNVMGGTIDADGDGLVDEQIISPNGAICTQAITVNPATLACNDDVNVILDSSACEVAIFPDMILENICGAVTPGDYTLIVGDPNLATNLVSTPGTYTYSITHNASGNSCWGTLTVEDKSGPSCTAVLEDKYYLCTADSTFQTIDLSNVDSFFLDCSEIVDVFYDDEMSDDCLGGIVPNLTGFEIVRTITRTWYAVDIYGNRSRANCSEIINIIRPLSTSITTARFVGLECGASTDPNDLSAAYVPVFLFPTSTDTVSLLDHHESCRYTFHYTDTETATFCNGGRKFIRSWSLIDWCSGSTEENFLTQQIAVKDTKAPIFTDCAEDDDEGGINNPHIISTDPYACSAAVELPIPTAEDDCGDDVTIDMVAVFQKVGTDYFQIGENFQLTGPLPVGSYYAVFSATDVCGNSSYGLTIATLTTIGNDGQMSPNCLVYFDVVDQFWPTASCNDELQVSIGNGIARIYAEDVDEGSWDACGIENMQVKRNEDDEWADYIEFGCEDVGNTTYVYLGVWDDGGYFNQCWVEIVAEDKFAPNCSDMEDISLFCDETSTGELGEDTGELWENDPAIISVYNEQFGNPFDNNVADNCEVVSVEQEYNIREWRCGETTIQRRYRAIDISGLTSGYCYQNITVNYRPNWSVTLPEDWEGMCGDGLPEASIEVNNGACDLIGWEYDDLYFDIVDNACYKVLRTYTIINWCTFTDEQILNPTEIERIEEGDLEEAISQSISNEDFPDSGYFTYTQVLRVHDQTAPVVSIADVELCIVSEGDESPFNLEDISPGFSPFECDEFRTFSASATDCNEAAEAALTFSWTIEENGVFAGSGDGDSFDWIIQPDIAYNVRFRVEDKCSNTSWEEKDFLFSDCTQPTPYCLNGLTINLASNTTTVSVWDEDLNVNSFDNCTAAENLQFRIWHASLGIDAPATLPDILDLPHNIEFNCTSLGIQSLNIYVIDEADNWAFCNTYVIVQDNMNECQLEGGGNMRSVSGQINAANGNPIKDVMLSVMDNSQTPATLPFETDDSGDYAFELNTNQNYTITPEKDINYPEGVSTLDLVIITQHILGINPFNSPYQWIAADVNRSNTISSFDIVTLRQLILGITTDFSNNTSWRFVDSHFEFSAANPLSENFPESIAIDQLTGNMTGMNFVAVKIGDVNNSSANLDGTEDRTAENLIFNIDNINIETGKTYTINFRAQDFQQLAGYQFTLDFNQNALEWIDLQEAQATKNNFGLHKAAEGLISTSWNGHATSNKMFALTFSAKQNGQLRDLINLNSSITTAEAYNIEGQRMNIALNFNNTNTAAGSFELYQNIPNPFTATTTIGFNLPTSSHATLSIMDISGKLLKSYDKIFNKGYNEIRLNSYELPTSGVVYYRLETDNNIATKKMVIVK